ncbi:isochorismatase [Halopseudomonas oceani]|uniref:Cysteine hydrolase n=1 Tax=Halopseudomonas oceani TaxID=1708783 RepID=A0A2P4EW60_9GAMM|nr:cysteine hydrolase family protein [Halopseudomonas oceani]POB04200.1 cysteine hydrolase [Halopseudomonas oceani]GGE30480.1 isochorismatase [Halopseudomonas oceani]
MKKAGLIVIDLQNDYLPDGKLPLTGIEAAAKNAADVIAAARTRGVPVFHVRHESPDSNAPLFAAGSVGAQIQTCVAPVEGEPVIVKRHINAFRETDLKQQLDQHGIEEVVVIGAMSHMCVDACVRAAVDMGYPATVLHDACATLDLEFNGVTTPAGQVQAAMMAAFEFGYCAVISTQAYLAAQ